MKLYKLTNGQWKTYGGCLWGYGVEHTASGKGELCGDGWLHAYTDPYLAELMNPIHAGFSCPILWEADGDVGATDHGLKVGCTRLRTVKMLDRPAVTLDHRVEFAIRCVRRICENPTWMAWSIAWLQGEDRSKKSANRIYQMVENNWDDPDFGGSSSLPASNAALAASMQGQPSIKWNAALAVEQATGLGRDFDVIALAHKVCK